MIDPKSVTDKRAELIKNGEQIAARLTQLQQAFAKAQSDLATVNGAILMCNEILPTKVGPVTPKPPKDETPKKGKRNGRK